MSRYDLSKMVKVRGFCQHFTNPVTLRRWEYDHGVDVTIQIGLGKPIPDLFEVVEHEGKKKVVVERSGRHFEQDVEVTLRHYAELEVA